MTTETGLQLTVVVVGVGATESVALLLLGRLFRSPP
jgi:hypothetical protein